MVEENPMQKSQWSSDRYDVVVCGAGSAGTAAAYAAASAGARTLLVERLGFCGGTPVAGAIHTLDAIRSCANYDETVVGGFATLLIDKTVELGGGATADNPPEALTLNLEYMKVAYDELLREAGVDVLFHALVTDVTMEGSTVTGVKLALLDGAAAVEADVVVDCTGDAGAVFHSGAGWNLDPELQALTYHFRLGNVAPGLDWEQMEATCQAAMQKHAPAGLVYGGPWIIRLNEHEISLNSTRAFGNPVDPIQRSNAEQQARADMLQIAGILLREVPELRDSYVLGGATDMHVRESRKMVGAYTLTAEDIEQCRVFPDAIAYGAWPIDIHPTNGFVGVHPHKDNPPRPYGIPYRCLVPAEVDGLLVAGKPISTTHRGHGSTRVPGTSMATGQAAGAAAALAARAGKRVRDVDTDVLRRELERQGAILPPVPAQV